MQDLVIKKIVEIINDDGLYKVLNDIKTDFNHEEYSLEILYLQFKNLIKDTMTYDELIEMLVRASVELISKEAPKWEFIAARLLSYKLTKEINQRYINLNIKSLYHRIKYLSDNNYYGKYILENYSEEEINELEEYIKCERNNLLNYSGLELIIKRYLIKDNEHIIYEDVQDMFMGIAMHLAIQEKHKLYFAKEFYDILSSLKVTMATPTIANARKPHHQMSSCFIDVVDDDLKSIYKSLDNFANISKFGGGMGLYFGKVRANGSDIRGYKNAAGGVIRWIKLVNDTAVAVDQLGVRSGAVAVYLDVWHKDLLDFLALRTNNGDDRMKAHDVFPAVCYPNLFWELAKKDLNSSWYLMCPHEILKVKGYALEDFYGDKWEECYYDCINDPRIDKKEVRVKDIIRLVIKSQVETGTPFVFNRDLVNEMNPNKHQGMIYSSNLCTEIAQNMSAIKLKEEKIIKVDNEDIVVNKYVPGNFVVCNLASLVLSNINVLDNQELEHVIKMSVRALDNVIDLNYYPVAYAKITNQKYRSIGLGTSGYHHMLVKHNIQFESDEHLKFVDDLYERINYYTLKTSCDLAKEKGRYEYFKDSDYDTGEYFKLRNYHDEKWLKLKEDIRENGLRNAYLLAIAPTSSTSIIAGTTASIDPVMNKYFMEEKKGMMITRVAPSLNPKTFWLYKNAHLINQDWVIKAAGIRQRHIDQAQSLNLYITNEYTFKQVLKLYLEAYENKIKTIYYIRSKSLEIEECESCSA